MSINGVQKTAGPAGGVADDLSHSHESCSIERKDIEEELGMSYGEQEQAAG